MTYWVVSIELLVVIDEHLLFELVVLEDDWFGGKIYHFRERLIEEYGQNFHQLFQKNSFLWHESICEKSYVRAKNVV